MTTSGVVVRRAGPAEAATVIAVLDAAGARSRARGYDMWPLGFTAESVGPALLAGRTWLATDRADRALATITVEPSDPLWVADAVAGYVHRVAARTARSGLGRLLLDWADGHVAQRGGDRLRLDCIAWDRPLRAYYEAAGFVHRGDVPLDPRPGVPPPERGSFALSRYERVHE